VQVNLHRISLFGLGSLFLTPSAIAILGPNEWVSVGNTYRVMSGVNIGTQCAYDQGYLVAVEKLAGVITPPEHGERPGRLEAVARLQKEIAMREKKGQTVIVPYNTMVKALEISPDRDGHGLPKYVRVVALQGPLKGHPFWGRYGFIKTLAPLANEPGVVQSKTTIWIPRMRNMMLTTDDMMRRKDTAGLASLVASGQVATVAPKTPIKVLNATVKGVYLIETTTAGGRRFKGWIDRRWVGAR